MRRLLILSLFATACATTPKTAPPQTDDPWPPADAALGIVNPALATLMAKHWAWTMEQSPLWATQLGVHRFDAALADRSRAGIEAARKQTRTWLESIKAIDGLEGTDLVTQKLIVEYLNNSIASEVCEFSDWSINARSNPVTEWNYLPELHTVESEEDATNLVSRYEGIGKAIDDTIANLERGVAAKHFANAESTRRVIKMVKDQLAKPIADWPLMSPTKADHPDWPQDKLQAFRKDIETAVTESIKPGLEEYLELVETKILPHARPADASGLTALPQGDACYAARVREYTNLDRTAEQIHKTGLAEIARINGEMKALGGKLFGTEDLPTVLQKLRTDPALYFDTEEQVEDKARTALAKAKAKMGDWFGLVPKADCIVTRIPDYEAPFTTVAYYRPPVPDGSKPGEYFINVYEPKTRPRYEAEALAFHEAIPGHHLQIAITQELPALPAFPPPRSDAPGGTGSVAGGKGSKASTKERTKASSGSSVVGVAPDEASP